MSVFPMLILCVVSFGTPSTSSLFKLNVTLAQSIASFGISYETSDSSFTEIECTSAKHLKWNESIAKWMNDPYLWNYFRVNADRYGYYCRWIRDTLRSNVPWVDRVAVVRPTVLHRPFDSVLHWSKWSECTKWPISRLSNHFCSPQMILWVSLPDDNAIAEQTWNSQLENFPLYKFTVMRSEYSLEFPRPKYSLQPVAWVTLVLLMSAPIASNGFRRAPSPDSRHRHRNEISMHTEETNKQLKFKHEAIR